MQTTGQNSVMMQTKMDIRPERIAQMISAFRALSSNSPQRFAQRALARRRGKKYLSCPDVDEREAEGQPRAERRDHAFREEVAGDERVQVQPDEFPPHALLGPPAAIRRRRHARVLENPPNRRSPDPQTQHPQLTDDAAIAPVGVLLGKALDELAEVPGDFRAADGLGLAPFSPIDDPPRIRMRRDNPDHAADVVARARFRCSGYHERVLRAQYSWGGR